MLFELSSRLGNTPEHWLEQPYAFALWAYRHLQELDRRRAWMKRMYRIEAATLAAMAFHDPNKLKAEHSAAIAEAGPVAPISTREELLAFSAQLTRDLESGRVFDD